VKPEPWEPYGVCNVCEQIVTVGEWNAQTHPCAGYWVSTGWQYLVNPRQTPWIPGYRFCVRQASQKVGRYNYHRKVREYHVYFEIDRDGFLQWTGGVKPTPRTQELVEEMYARNRPGSNYFEEDAAA
jgi:hypothetical protein